MPPRPRCVSACLLRVLNDRGPRVDGSPGASGIAEHVGEDAAHVKLPGRVGGIHAENAAPREATARFVLEACQRRSRIVGLLGFPGDGAVLDARSSTRRGAVQFTPWVERDLVVAPAVAVEESRRGRPGRAGARRRTPCRDGHRRAQTGPRRSRA